MMKNIKIKKTEGNEESAEVLAAAIIKIADGFEKLLSTPLEEQVQQASESFTDFLSRVAEMHKISMYGLKEIDERLLALEFKKPENPKKSFWDLLRPKR